MGWGAFWRKKGHRSEWRGKGLGLSFSAVWISRGRAIEESITNPGASSGYNASPANARTQAWTPRNQGNPGRSDGHL